MRQQPRPFLNKFKLRHQAIGLERRRNMSKLILENQTYLPKPIEYSDIDQAMYEWVDKKIDLAYDGKRLPTYKLYSTQRLSEYMQSWNELDEGGNLIINFKIVTRENNPQKGEEQGNYFNIPGHKDFAMFYVPVLEENGVEAYDKYTMKQPTQVNFTYSVSIITNKMELLNKMNEKMHYEFNAITCYISPCDHPMPMTLEDISDDSEYTIDDRKYYSQTYKIKLKGYIIRKEDYSVERIPSRLVFRSNEGNSVGRILKRKKNREEKEKVDFIKGWDEYRFSLDYMKTVDDNMDSCDVPPLPSAHDPNSNVEIVEEPFDDGCEKELEEGRYYNKAVRVNLNFDECETEIEFVIDTRITLLSIETENVFDFRFYVNNELMDFLTSVKIMPNDTIKCIITKDDPYKGSKITLVGYDPDSVFDRLDNPESSLDEVPDELEIDIEK